MIDVDKDSNNVGDYTFNMLGNRVKKVTDTDTIKMLYDGYNCVADYNDADNLLRHYITPGLDENVLVYDVDKAEEYFYLHDGLGTVRQIINDTQTIENNYDYEGFGTSISHSENIYNRYRYTGREYDKETESDPTYNSNEGTKDGLYYYRARTYDSTIGSFTSRDPIPASNLYPYCSANPITFIDPFGLEEFKGYDESYVKVLEEDMLEHFPKWSEGKPVIDALVDPNGELMKEMCKNKDSNKKLAAIIGILIKAAVQDLIEKILKNFSKERMDNGTQEPAVVKALQVTAAALNILSGGNIYKEKASSKVFKRLRYGEDVKGYTGYTDSKTSIQIPNWGDAQTKPNAEPPKWGNSRLNSGNNAYKKIWDDEKLLNDALKNGNFCPYLQKGKYQKERIQAILDTLERIMLHEFTHLVSAQKLSRSFKVNKVKNYYFREGHKKESTFGLDWTRGARTNNDGGGLGSDGSAVGDGVLTGEKWWAKLEQSWEDSSLFK